MLQTSLSLRTLPPSRLGLSFTLPKSSSVPVSVATNPPSALSVSAAPADPTPPMTRPRKSVAAILASTLLGGLHGAVGGVVGGTLGGVIGGLSGLSSGALLGGACGNALGLRLAEKTGQGQVNPIAGGIGSLALPLALGAAGALAGTISCSIAGAQGMPLVGAAIGAGCALITELVR